MDKYINAPISDEDAKSLHSGDYVYITGIIYTARDAAHKRMAEALSAGQPLPIDMKNNIIYYMGPSPAREGRPIGSAGPTTASRASFWIQIGLAVAILGILVFIVLRSARPLTVEEKEPELSVEEMLASTKENQPSVDDIDLQEKSETRKAIEKFVDENPEAVALLLRNWLNDDW